MTIKFRAWDSGRSQWRDGAAIDEFGDQYSWQKVKAPDHYAYVKQASNFLTISFSTGLTDYQDREIYEGDIVVDLRDDDKKPQEVRWFRGGFMLQTKGHFGFHDIESYDGDCRYFKIIDNIYENPELMK